MKLTDKTIRTILIGLAILIFVGFIIMKYRSTYAYPIPAAVTKVDEDTAFESGMLTCQNEYNIALNNGTAEATAKAALDTCVKSKVDTFIAAKCPQASTTYVAPDGDVNYTTYKNNLVVIQNAYVPVVGEAGSDEVLLAQIRAARRADITGATRQYLATSCPSTATTQGFYVPSGATTIDTTVETIYQNWAAYTAGTAIPQGKQYYFDASKINKANIQAWAVNAGTGFDENTGIPSGPLLATGSKYNKPDPAVDTTPPNWALARDFGPGTVVISGTNMAVTWSKADGTTITVTVPVTYVA